MWSGKWHSAQRHSFNTADSCAFLSHRHGEAATGSEARDRDCDTLSALQLYPQTYTHRLSPALRIHIEAVEAGAHTELPFFDHQS